MKKPEQSKTTIALKENVLEYNMWIKLSKSCFRKKKCSIQIIRVFYIIIRVRY